MEGIVECEAKNTVKSPKAEGSDQAGLGRVTYDRGGVSLKFKFIHCMVGKYMFSKSFTIYYVRIVYLLFTAALVVVACINIIRLAEQDI